MPARARAQLLPEAEGLEGRGEAKQLPLLWKSIPILHREGPHHRPLLWKSIPMLHLEVANPDNIGGPGETQDGSPEQ